MVKLVQLVNAFERACDFVYEERCRVCQRICVSHYQGDYLIRAICFECWQAITGSAVIVSWCRLAEGRMLVLSGTYYFGVVKTLIYKVKYDRDLLLNSDLSCLLSKPL